MNNTWLLGDMGVFAPFRIERRLVLFATDGGPVQCSCPCPVRQGRSKHERDGNTVGTGGKRLHVLRKAGRAW